MVKRLLKIALVSVIIIFSFKLCTFAADYELSVSTEDYAEVGSTGIATITLNAVDDVGVISGVISANSNVTSFTVEALNSWSKIAYNNGSFKLLKAEGGKNENVLKITYTVSGSAEGNVQFTISNISLTTINYQTVKLNNLVFSVAIEEPAALGLSLNSTVNTNASKIINNDIYFKLDGDEENITKVSDFLDLINISGKFSSLTLTLDDNTSYSWSSKSNFNSDPNGYKENTLLKIKSIHAENTDENFTYNIYQLGDVYDDECSENSAININDVINLRKAIIGDNEVLSNENFEIKNSDVNFSNDTAGTLGDIGDIISIRQRILYYEWKDIN